MPEGRGLGLTGWKWCRDRKCALVATKVTPGACLFVTVYLGVVIAKIKTWSVVNTSEGSVSPPSPSAPPVVATVLTSVVTAFV